MPKALADREVFSYVAESTWGTTPTSPTLQNLRLVTEDLSSETANEHSKEIRPDGQITDHLRLGHSVAGSINFELTYGTFDDFFAAICRDSAWSSAVTDVASDAGIAANNTGNQFEGTDGEFTNYTVGSWVYVTGFTETANNGLFKIVAINSSDPGTSDDDELVVSGGTLTTEASGDSVSITQLSEVTNGTDATSFTFQRQHTDITQFAVFTGVRLNTMSLTLAANKIIEGSFGVMGRRETRDTSAISGSSNTTANTNPIMTTADHVSGLLENQTSFEANEVTFSIDLQHRQLPIVASQYSADINPGLFMVSGTAKVYFENKTLLDKYLAWTDTPLAFLLADADGNRYVIDMPATKLATGKTPNPGQSTDIMAEFEYKAKMHATEGITLRIARLPAS